MDPTSALSLAVNIIQIVDFSSKLLTGATEIYHSADGALVEHSELKAVTKGLSRQVAELDKALEAKKSEKDLSEDEKDLRHLGQECSGVAAELLSALEKLKVQGTNKRWKSFRQALLSIWHGESIDMLEKRLKRFREQMVMNTLSNLRDAVEAANQQQSTVLQHVNNIEQGTQSIGEAFLSHIEDSGKWHRDLIEAIHRNHWDARPFGGIAGPARQREASHLSMKILHKLHFDDIEDRHHRIPEAYKKTFEWIYRDPEAGQRRWTSYINWLEKGDDMYWITGKAGSGKSTLMKYLYDNPMTIQHLIKWASPHTLVTSAFFFWNSGSKMQMSKQGLLQSLLYKVLSCQPSLIPKLFPEQWEVYSLFGEDSRAWRWSDLVTAMIRLVKENCLTMRFCFFIDGLDEFDGDHSDLIELLDGIGKSSGVKICVSSRPWPVFEDAFDSKPSLMLQDLTYPDFQLFVEGKFRNNAGFLELEQREPKYAAVLLEDIARKASGIFLWVHLVVRSLLAGLTNGDRISDLQRRLDLLPPDLEDLFRKMLESIDPFYLEHASQLFEIVRVALVPPTLLCVSLADEENPEFVFRARVRPMSEVFLEVTPLPEPHQQIGSGDPSMLSMQIDPVAGKNHEQGPASGVLEPPLGRGDLMCNMKVQYLHRTVKDFLETPEVMNKILTAADPSFNPYRSLCTSYILQLKTSHPDVLTVKGLWDLVTWCLEYAAQTEKETGSPETQLLDELDRAATTIASSPTREGLTFMELHARSVGLQRCPHWTNSRFSWVSGSSFLHLAALCGFHKYLSVKLGQDSIHAQGLTTPLLDTVLAEYTAFVDYKEKPYCSAALLPFETIQLLLEKGSDPHHVSRGRTPWQILLSEPHPGTRGPLSNWLKAVESFILSGADDRMGFEPNQPVWKALSRQFPQDMERLEALMLDSTARANVQHMGQFFASWTRRYRRFSPRAKYLDENRQNFLPTS